MKKLNCNYSSKCGRCSSGMYLIEMLIYLLFMSIFVGGIVIISKQTGLFDQQKQIVQESGQNILSKPLSPSVHDSIEKF